MNEYTDYILWGSAGHAKVLAEVIELHGGKVIALFDNNNNAVSAIKGVPVYYGEATFRKWIKDCKKDSKVAGLVAIGGGRGFDRLSIYKLFRENNINIDTLIHPKAVVSITAMIGSGCQILANSVVAVDVKIGEAGIVNHNASVDHECVLGNGVHIAPGATLCGCVIVEDGAFIGAGAVVLPRVKIGANSVIGAGAVVIKDVEPSVVDVGNPARIIAKSNIIKY